MKNDVLTRPFPSELVKQRQGQGGRAFSYIETSSVIARLNEGCDTWSFEIVEHEIRDEEVIVVAKLTADGVVKMAFGGSSITRDREGRATSIADDLKAAGSDALKKAASLLGVGLELYGGGAGRDVALHEPSSPQPEVSAPPLTEKQYAAVQVITRRQNIDGEHLAEMLEERFKKGDLRRLSRREASLLLSELTGSNGVG